MCDPGVRMLMLRAGLRAPRTAESHVAAGCAGRGGRAARLGWVTALPLPGFGRLLAQNSALCRPLGDAEEGRAS